MRRRRWEDGEHIRDKLCKSLQLDVTAEEMRRIDVEQATRDDGSRNRKGVNRPLQTSTTREEPPLLCSSILIVDDDLQLACMLREYLYGERFSVCHAPDGVSAMQILVDQKFDLVVLDIMMPELSGLEVLQRLRLNNDVPVLMLTARGEDDDRIAGLNLGADDYLSKPFNPRELVARMRAILRRRDRSMGVPGSNICIGSLALNPADLSVFFDERSVRLTVAEFLVLEVLARSAGRPQTRAVLSERALGRPLEAYDRSIDTHISNIRKKLELVSGGPLEIRSMRGLGYMLNAVGPGT